MADERVYCDNCGAPDPVQEGAGYRCQYCKEWWRPEEDDEDEDDDTDGSPA